MKGQKVNQLKWGVVITYGTLFLNIIISILYTPVMLRLLGPGEHGLYSTISSTMSWLSLLSLGVGASYIRFYSKYKVNNQEDYIASLNGLFLIFYSIVSTVTLVCGFVISQNLHFVFADGITASEYQTARILAIIVTIDFAIGFPASLFNAIIKAHENFIQVKLVNLMQCITTPMITLPLLLMGYGSVAMVAVTTSVNLFAYCLNIFFCFKKLHTKFKFSGFEKGIVKNIASFSLVVALNSVINMLNTSVDKMLLARFVGTVSVSVYTIGFSLYSYYSSFSSAIAGIMVPRINRIVNQNTEDKQMLRKELTEQFTKVGRIQFYIQMLMCTGILFFGKQFIFFWAGENYKNSYWVALLLCLACTVPLIQSTGAEIQRAQNKHRFRTILYVIMTSFNVILTIILCQLYGEVGAAVGTAIAMIAIDVIVMNIYYHKKLYIDIIYFWKNILKISKGLILPVAVGIIITAFIQINSVFELAIYIAIYSLIYCISIWFLSMSNDEKNIIFGKIMKNSKKKES